VAFSFKQPVIESAAGPTGSADIADCVRVFEGEFDYVFRTLQRLGASPADAEDLAQEVFLVMWRRRADWNPQAPLRPWLAAIAYRVTLAHRRRSVREVPVGLLDAEDQSQAVEDQLAEAGARRLVLETLSALPPKQRAVLVLHELDGLPMKDIAQSLRLPLFTAYSRLRVARQRFAKELRRREQLGALAPRAAGRHQVLAAMPAGALLAAERSLPPAPAAVKRRVVGRISRLAPAGRLPGPDLAPALRAVRLRPMALVAGAAVLAVLAGFSGNTRGRGKSSALPAAPAARPAATTRIGARVDTPATVPRLGPARLAALPAAAEPGAPEKLGAGVVAYWRFDEARGTTTARDLSGLGVDCVLRRVDSTDWTEGPIGRAIQLTGGGWVECPASAGLRRITDRITIATWVWRAKPQPHLRTIVSRQFGRGSDDDFYLALVGKRLLFSSRVWGRLEVPIPQEMGRWFHVAAVGESDGSLHLYLDGAEIAARGPDQRKALSLAASPDDNPLLVGAANNFSDPTIVDQKLNGAIDELLLYDRALGPREIAQLASRVQPRLSP
jgi:RNA polymerase sigma-70 factor (ECF subfamily)